MSLKFFFDVGKSFILLIYFLKIQIQKKRKDIFGLFLRKLSVEKSLRAVESACNFVFSLTRQKATQLINDKKNVKTKLQKLGHHHFLVEHSNQ